MCEDLVEARRENGLLKDNTTKACIVVGHIASADQGVSTVNDGRRI